MAEATETRYKVTRFVKNPLSASPPLAQVNDRVEYRPVGGGADNVSHSVGEIVEVHGSGADLRYRIKNDNTGRTTSYQEKNIVKKLEP